MIKIGKNNKKKTQEEYILEVSQINLNVKVIGKYINARTKILHECKICENKWEATPGSILRGIGCKKCATRLLSDKKMKSHEDFVKELHSINDSIEVIGNYVGANRKIEIKCKTCGNIWNSTASNLLRGSGCPNCNLSHLERNTMVYLDRNNIEYIYQMNYDDLIGVNNGVLSYDFYLPQYNLLIEDQGKQHERPIEYFGGEEQFKIQREHDKRKREYAKSHNINLLEIWYYDKDNIEEILSNELNNLKSKCVETVIPT